MEYEKETLIHRVKNYWLNASKITSDVETGSSVCIRLRISATLTDAFPFALTFGINPKLNYKKQKV